MEGVQDLEVQDQVNLRVVEDEEPVKLHNNLYYDKK